MKTPKIIALAASMTLMATALATPAAERHREHRFHRSTAAPVPARIAPPAYRHAPVHHAHSPRPVFIERPVVITRPIYYVPVPVYYPAPVYYPEPYYYAEPTGALIGAMIGGIIGSNF